MSLSDGFTSCKSLRRSAPYFRSVRHDSVLWFCDSEMMMWFLVPLAADGHAFFSFSLRNRIRAEWKLFNFIHEKRENGFSVSKNTFQNVVVVIDGWWRLLINWTRDVVCMTELMSRCANKWCDMHYQHIKWTWFVREWQMVKRANKKKKWNE